MMWIKDPLWRAIKTTILGGFPNICFSIIFFALSFVELFHLPISFLSTIPHFVWNNAFFFLLFSGVSLLPNVWRGQGLLVFHSSTYVLVFCLLGKTWSQEEIIQYHMENYLDPLNLKYFLFCEVFSSHWKGIWNQRALGKGCLIHGLPPWLGQISAMGFGGPPNNDDLGPR